ncbi:MAG: hypothetical protein R3A12_06085 [Ignavibacteria bacterium]
MKSLDSRNLLSLMEGSFNSEEQAKNDSDYYDIRLHMKRIWLMSSAPLALCRTVCRGFRG